LQQFVNPMSFTSIVKYTKENTASKWRVPFYVIKGMYYFLLKKVLPEGKITVKAFNGSSVYLLKNNSFTSVFTYAQIPESVDIRFLRAHIHPNTVLLDIGANIGAYSIMMLDVCSKVYAFEPHPVTFKHLEKNNELNGNKISLVNKGLGDQEALLPFTNIQSEMNHIIKEQANKTAGDIAVQITTLDNFAEQNLSKNDRYIIKIDVEGFEDEVLKGGVNFFSNYSIDAMVIEADDKRRNKMIEELISKGFVCEFSDNSNNIRAYKSKQLIN